MLCSRKKSVLISIAISIACFFEQQNNASPVKPAKKDWTFISYIAADNDLRGFAARNIKQMAQVGSNSRINIVAQLDIRIQGNKKTTRRYYIEKNSVIHVNAHDPNSQCLDSGNPKSLISCCKWAIENYPAKNYALVLWNHGTGILDPISGKIIRAADLFSYNPVIHKLELNRSLGFLDFIDGVQPMQRGICWDDSTRHFLTNQKLEEALHKICSHYLHGKKFNIIIFDACLMSMLEVAGIIKNYAHVMAASQEVELGTGLDYHKLLHPFESFSPNEKALGAHIVSVYKAVYERITNDYTYSALDLSLLHLLEKNIDMVAQLLLKSLKLQANNSVKNALKTSRNKRTCTHFDEPSYIDLHHIYKNIHANIKHFSYQNPTEGNELSKSLKQLLEEGMHIIKKITLANAAGKNLSQAQGISVYFPERRIHSSYRKTKFGTHNHWATFLTQYILL